MQEVIAYTILAVAAALTAVRIYRSIKGKTPRCNCHNCEKNCHCNANSKHCSSDKCGQQYADCHHIMQK